MGHLYAKNTTDKKKIKISFYAASMWRSMYLITSNPVHHTSEKKIRSRSSTVPYTFHRSEVLVHSGKRWISKRISTWHIGYKFGEFTWNRKFALYKAKQLRKKAKKKK